MFITNGRRTLFKLILTGIFCMISLPGLSQADNADITAEEYVKHIFAATSRAWPELEKTWNTTAFRNIRLIVADSHDAWAVDSKNLIKIPYSEVQQRHLAVEYMNYQEIQWPDGRPTIYVSMGPSLPEEEKARFRSEKKPVPELFNVATHEAFHYFVQADAWERGAQSTYTRATTYPVQATPRFYRNNIIRALYASLQGDPAGLGHARYWSNLWKERYHDEASRIRQTDVEEGSARYIEIAAEIIAQGIHFNTPEFQHAVTDKIKDEANIVYTSADSESYIIGALAGFILNTRNVEWQSDVEQGIPPLDILLKDVTAIKERADETLRTDVNQQVSEINNTTDIDNFVRAYKYPGVIRILVDSNLSGSYELGGFFRTNAIPYDLMTGVSSSANWPGGSYSIKESVAAAIDGEAPGYHGKKGLLFLYAGKIPPADNGRLILNTKRLSLDIPYPENIEKTKMIYLHNRDLK